MRATTFFEDLRCLRATLEKSAFNNKKKRKCFSGNFQQQTAFLTSPAWTPGQAAVNCLSKHTTFLLAQKFISSIDEQGF